MKKTTLLFGVLTSGLLATAASAQLVINPVTHTPADKIGLGASLSYSSIRYNLNEGTDESRASRWVCGFSASKAYDENTDLCGSVAWLADSGGYLLSLGARSQVFERGLASVSVFGLGHYMSDDFDGDDVDLFELTGGVVGAYAIKPSLTAYAGVELVAYSDGEARNGAVEYDVERDGRFIVRGGTIVALNKFWVRGELALGAETALTVGAGCAF